MYKLNSESEINCSHRGWKKYRSNWKQYKIFKYYVSCRKMQHFKFAKLPLKQIYNIAIAQCNLPFSIEKMHVLLYVLGVYYLICLWPIYFYIYITYVVIADQSKSNWALRCSCAGKLVIRDTCQRVQPVFISTQL